MKTRTLLTLIVILVTLSGTTHAVSESQGKVCSSPVWDPPVPIYQVKPEYPESVREGHLTGEVVLDVHILINGTVDSINVLKSLEKGPGGCDEAAVEAVKQWKFKPERIDGRPAEVWVQFPVGFGMDDGEEQYNRELQEQQIQKPDKGRTKARKSDYPEVGMRIQPNPNRAGESNISIIESEEDDPWENETAPPMAWIDHSPKPEDYTILAIFNYPEYPESAAREHIRGAVELSVEVLDNGRVGKVEVTESLQDGPGGCDEAAVEAVKKWLYLPRVSAGKEQRDWVLHRIEFNEDMDQGWSYREYDNLIVTRELYEVERRRRRQNTLNEHPPVREKWIHIRVPRSEHLLDTKFDIHVLADGTVDSILVFRPKGIDDTDFDRKMKNAVRHWAFKPAMKDGHPVAAWGQFSLYDNDKSYPWIRQSTHDSESCEQIWGKEGNRKKRYNDPFALKRVRNVYVDAKNWNLIGKTIILDVYIQPDGSVGSVAVIQSLNDLFEGIDEQAIEAAKQWRFRPRYEYEEQALKEGWKKIPIQIKRKKPKTDETAKRRILKGPIEAIVPRKVVDPIYLATLRNPGVPDKVGSWIHIDTDGNVDSVRILGGWESGKQPGPYDEIAREALKQWKFEPVVAGGEVVDTGHNVYLAFGDVDSPWINRLRRQNQPPNPKHGKASSAASYETNNRAGHAIKGIERKERSPAEKLAWNIAKYYQPPVPIHRVEPDVPETAKAKGISGEVLLEVEVRKDGSVNTVNVIESLQKGTGGCDEAAVEAMKQWKFEPANSFGQPFDIWIQVPMRFGGE